MNERITKGFKDEYQRFTSKSITIDDLYIYSQMLMMELKRALYNIHNKSFHERFKEKIINNPKLNNNLINFFDNDHILNKI